MEQITLSEYNNLPQDYRGVWNTERSDFPNWEQIRHQFMGKRTMMQLRNGSTCLLIEDMHFEIVSDKQEAA